VRFEIKDKGTAVQAEKKRLFKNRAFTHKNLLSPIKNCAFFTLFLNETEWYYVLLFTRLCQFTGKPAEKGRPLGGHIENTRRKTWLIVNQ